MDLIKERIDKVVLAMKESKNETEFKKKYDQAWDEYNKIMETVKFEDLGFFIEYIIDGKLIGMENVKENKNGKIGWASTEHFIAINDKEFFDYQGKKTNKKIKRGQRYKTRIYPLCGKWINK